MSLIPPRGGWGWTYSLFSVCASSFTSPTNSGSVPYSVSSVKSNFTLKIDNQK